MSKKIFFTLTACLFLGLTVLSQTYKYKSVPNDPLNTRIYKLENGLTVYLSQNKDEPRIQANIAVRAGSKNDPSDATGLAHYLEHMLFKGTSELATTNWKEEKVLLDKIEELYELHRTTDNPDKKKQIYAEIDKLSYEASKYAIPNEYDKIVSSLGASGTNAYTSTERTVYINDIPSNELERFLLLESEKFSEAVLRIFHTELETVYEEFNRAQDNDRFKAFMSLDKALYEKHPYGTQTTIGKGEHLKNPSMTEIYKYFNTYYVPNNMAVILAGDLDYDKTIALVDKYFGTFKAKPVPGFKFQPEEPITTPKEIEVFGPMQEWVTVAYRFPGYHNKSTMYLDIISELLSNGEAGLIDLNLNQKQIILGGRCSYSADYDYSSLQVTGSPKGGQSLEEVKGLLLLQVEKVKQGEFEESLIQAIVKDKKIQQLQWWNEYNSLRATALTDAFILKKDWEKEVNKYDRWAKVTKKEIVDFAKNSFNNNYVVLYKRTGEDKNTYKVEKPAITPIEINRDSQSAFYKKIMGIEAERMEPVFVDYEEEIKKERLNTGIEVNYIKNPSNELFSLNYIWDMGTDNNRKIDVALEYLNYLGTDKYTAEELKQEFYKMGLSYSVSSSRDRIVIELSGLESDLEKGLPLFEHLLANAEPNEQALKELVKDINKSRANQMKNKDIILHRAMASYAKYGEDSPQLNQLSAEELQNLTGEELTDIIKSLTSYQHKVFYYGKKELNEVVDLLNKEYKKVTTYKEYPPAKEYKELETTENKVLFMDYDMVQTQMLFMSKDEQFDKKNYTNAWLFNEYFGSGLSSITFQEIREAKALAYTAYAAYTTPDEVDEAHYVQAFVGTQVDKLDDAVEAMLALMNEMPKAEEQFNGAKESALKRIESNRITKENIFWSYERNKKKGLEEDVRKEIYAEMKDINIDDLEEFFNGHIKGKKYTFLVIGDEDAMDFEALEKLGKVEKLTLKDVFGYEVKP